MAVNVAGQNVSLATLYVGDLEPDITEAQLFERFSAAGPVLSIRVCRDQITKQSLGYAYVNFQQPADAERALDTMNFDMLQTRPMRIMWSQRDPALRKNGVGNVFIKNLDKSIDNKALYDTFSTFGNILSCKIMNDETGNSKGYGFVHFETQEAADKAIASVNNMLLNNKKVFVGQFLSKNQRNEDGGPYRKYTNVFVKNFADQLDDSKLSEMFEKYGEITSAVVARDQDGKSKGFGFVNFKEPHCAEAAVKEMNDQVIGDKKLLVGAFQKKTERLSDLKKKYEDEKRERLSKYSGVNLYIKNLDDKIDDEKLRKEFQPFGTITSAKVMTEGGRSKGFGFVCFSAPEEATRAVTEMNSRIVGSKPLYVALAQRKEERRNHLTNQYMQRISTMRMQNQQLQPAAAAAMGINPQQMGGGQYGAQQAAGGMQMANAMFMPQLAAAQNAARLYQQAPAMYAAQQVRPTPRWATNAQQQRSNGGGQPQYQSYQMLGQGGPRARMPYQPQQQQQQQGQNPAAAAVAAAQAAQQQAMIRPQNAAQQAAVAQQARLQAQQQQQQYGQAAANPMAYAQQQQQMQQRVVNAGVANGQQQQQRQPTQQQQKLPYRAQQGQGQQQQGSINVPGQEPLTTDMLAAAQPQEQKQLLGERLYPLIQNMHPEWAGKITGMLLEIDNAELLHMLDSRESLKEKVDEAVAVLKNHQMKSLQAEQ